MRFYDHDDPASVEAFERGEPTYFLPSSALGEATNSADQVPDEWPPEWREIGYVRELSGGLG